MHTPASGIRSLGLDLLAGHIALGPRPLCPAFDLSVEQWGKSARSVVKGVCLVAGLGVAHLPHQPPGRRVRDVERLDAVLAKDPTNAVHDHKVWDVRHDNVAHLAS